MGKYSSIAIGKASGSAGGLTFGSWKGQKVFKQKAETVANPRTAAQTAQRSRMAFIVSLYQLMATFIKSTYKASAKGMSEFNAFTSTNLKNGAITPINGVPTLVKENLQVSAGTLRPVSIDSAVYDDNTEELTVNFNAQVLEGESVNDIISLLVINGNNEVVLQSIGAGERQDNQNTYAIPAAKITNAGNCVYLMLSQPANGKFSNSTAKLFVK